MTSEGQGEAGSRAPLETALREQMTAAMKAGDKVRLGALRLLIAAITNREKDLRRALSDDEIREVAGKEVKKRTESIEAFEAAGREELAERERAEREVLRNYAPEQLDEAIATTGATSIKEMGKVMGQVMAKAKGKVDGAEVQRRVRERLGA